MAESVTQRDFRGTHRGVHEFICQAETDASLAAYTANDKDGNAIVFRLEEVSLIEIVPGATGPSNGAWDLFLKNDDGIDILEAQGANLSSSAPVTFKPMVNSAVVDSFPLWGGLTLSITGNAVNSAQFTCRFYYDLNNRDR